MAGHDNDSDDGFNAVSKAYQMDPSIENYVKLRRESPDAEIDISSIGGTDGLFLADKDFNDFGIETKLLIAIRDGDPGAISKVSLRIMERMIESRSLANAGETQLVSRELAVPDSLIDLFLKFALDSLSWKGGLQIPNDLLVLLRERLGGSSTRYKKAATADRLKMRAAVIGGELLATGVEPSLRKVAYELGVAPSTVMRRFPVEGEFETETKFWAKYFDKVAKIK